MKDFGFCPRCNKMCPPGHELKCVKIRTPKPDLFKSPLHYKSRLGVYQPTMSKTAAYSKLSFSSKENQKIKDLSVMVNLLNSKINRMGAQNPKRPILSGQLRNYQNSLNELKEHETKRLNERNELLKYIESNNGETIPAASVYAFLTNKPLPLRPTVAPKTIPDAGMVSSQEQPPADQPVITDQMTTANVEAEKEGDTTVVPPPSEPPPQLSEISENEAKEIKPNEPQSESDNEEVYSSNFESPYITPESDIGDAAFRPLFLRKKYGELPDYYPTSTEDSEYEPPPKEKSRKEQLMEKTEKGGYISSTVHPKSEKAKTQLRLTEKPHPVGDETDAEQLAQLMNIPKEEAKRKLKEAHPLGKEEPEEQPASGDDTFEATEKGSRLKVPETVPEKVEEFEGKTNRPSASYLTKWAKHYERNNGRFPDLWLTREQYTSQRAEKGKSKGNYTEYLRNLAEGNRDYEEWKKRNKP